MINGNYATYISAAWAPGYLTGAGVGKGQDTGKFAVAPLPQWDPANPVQVNWGGSAFSVTKQAKKPELAAKVAYGLYADKESLTDGWTNQIIFPLNLTALKDPAFVDLKVAFFNGQQANKEVYLPAAERLQGRRVRPVRSVLPRRHGRSRSARSSRAPSPVRRLPTGSRRTWRSTPRNKASQFSDRMGGPRRHSAGRPTLHPSASTSRRPR